MIYTRVSTIPCPLNKQGLIRTNHGDVHTDYEMSAKGQGFVAAAVNGRIVNAYYEGVCTCG